MVVIGVSKELSSVAAGSCKLPGGSMDPLITDFE